jgi:hypothetical protein
VKASVALPPAAASEKPSALKSAEAAQAAPAVVISGVVPLRLTLPSPSKSS